jgi:hypothetical protein
MFSSSRWLEDSNSQSSVQWPDLYFTIPFRKNDTSKALSTRILKPISHLKYYFEHISCFGGVATDAKTHNALTSSSNRGTYSTMAGSKSGSHTNNPSGSPFYRNASISDQARLQSCSSRPPLPSNHPESNAYPSGRGP